MKIIPKETVDNLLSQATCAVLINDTLKATAWLVSQDGHLLTVGHIFENYASTSELSVQFLDDSPRKAHRLFYTYNRESGDDFAILKLTEGPISRRPLRTALFRSVSGNCKLQGYGKTFYHQSVGQGEFLGMFYPQNFTDTFLYKLRSPETGESGFSGAAVFSEDIQAVVAIQTEATNAEVGAERDTVLAMPLYRIAQRWQLLSKLTEHAHASELDARNKFKSPKHYLEHQIRENYRVYQNSTDSTDILRTKYYDVICIYLQIYFILCRRTSRLPNPDIVEIKSHFPSVNINISTETLASTIPTEIYTNLPGTRITVGVSQMFRIADLLTRPESVKAREFYEAITDTNKLRRAFSSKKKKSFRMGSLGSLRTVLGKSEEHDRFWRPAIPNLRLPTVQPLHFIPYELSLTPHLQKLKLESAFDSVTDIGTSSTIKNSQINGRLRIYPPGIGVISMSIDLEFKQDIAVEVAAQIAHNIEELLFVGPEDLRKPYNALMLDIIERVINSLFVDEGYSFEERRWRPPATTFSFPQVKGLKPEGYSNELSYLMSLAPANGEGHQKLFGRIQSEMKAQHWKADRVLAVAGDGVALLFIDDLHRPAQQRRDNFLLWLSETYELVSAAAYAQQAFAEEIDTIFNQRILDESWLPQSSSNFYYLKSLLGTMLQVMRAISTIGDEHGHLRNQGAGILMKFAKDVWTYNNPVNRPALEKGLRYIAEWVADSRTEWQEPELIRLEGQMRSLQSIHPTFRTKMSQTQDVSASSQQEQLEDNVLALLAELEEILQRNETEEFEESDRRRQIMQKLKREIGL